MSGTVGVADGGEDGKDELPARVGVGVRESGAVVGGVGDFAGGAFEEVVAFFADERGEGRGRADRSSAQLAAGAGSGGGAVGAEGFAFRPVAVGVEYLPMVRSGTVSAARVSASRCGSSPSAAALVVGMDWPVRRSYQGRFGHWRGSLV